jgi:pyruvate dehydrogenase E2 component (dihydrolipoamide acetyltransferase)
MPKWGIEMTEGTVTGWHLTSGQPIEKGVPLLDVETEKIVNVVDAPGSGLVRRILAEAGQTLPVGALLGIIADAAASDEEIAKFIDNFSAAVVSFEPDAPTGAATTTPATAGGDAVADSEGRVSPIARRVAERLGVDLSQIQGSGRNGRISKQDVEAFAARRTAREPATTAVARQVRGANSPTRVPMSARRLTSARRLLEAKQQIPHYRLEVDLDGGPLLARKRLLAEQGERVSLNDLIVRAAALALVQHPAVNAQLAGEEILQFPHADIAVAIATDAGLITPIVRGADLMTVAQIAAEIRDFADRARRAQLTREEITGGTFTVSNLGMYGVARFDAIINPPQVAILAVGALGERVVSQDGAFAAAQMLTLTLSADHRVVDGAIGAAFLATLRKLLSAATAL